MTYRHRNKKLCRFCKEYFSKFRRNLAYLQLFLDLEEIMIGMKECGNFRLKEYKHKLESTYTS